MNSLNPPSQMAGFSGRIRDRRIKTELRMETKIITPHQIRSMILYASVKRVH